MDLVPLKQVKRCVFGSSGHGSHIAKIANARVRAPHARELCALRKGKRPGY